MSNKVIFKKIKDLNKTIKELTSNIHIEDLFNIIPNKEIIKNDDNKSVLIPKDSNGKPYDDLKITYGVNVRLSKDAADDFFPFSFCYPEYDSAKAVSKIKAENMIQGFLNQFFLKEIMFTVKLDIYKKEINIEKIIENTVVEASKKIGINEVEEWLQNENTFLYANIKELEQSSHAEEYFVWICGEDPDITDENCGYLTNIMVITNNEQLREVVFKKKNAFIEFVMWLKSRRSFDSDVKFKNEAIKSAKAAIMSRNMSHNLGSHVMSYLKQNLSSVKNIFHDRILALLVKDPNSIQIDKEIQSAIKEGDQGILPFLVGLGQFISYIQERQDFIATIATDFIPYLSTVNFKDFIYDELNPDKRYERHSTRQNYKTDNILLGNIARSEGLGRKTSPTEGVQLNNIVLYFRDFDGDPVELQEDGHPTGKPRSGREKEFATLKDMRSYDFSLPGGVVGRQAVFSIVENVIRNAAKHGNWREKGQLELTFNIFTKEDIETPDNSTDYNNACLDDKEGTDSSLSLREVFKKFYMHAIDAKDLYFITLTDNLSMNEAKLDKLRKAINEPLVNEKGEMNEASKGIKEMRISSTWLRSLNEGEAYNPIVISKENNVDIITPETEWPEIKNNQNAPTLYARISHGHLQYIFCVLRPKKVAIISSVFSNNSEENNNSSKNEQNYNKQAFSKFSWAAFTPQQYRDIRNKSYEFIIFDDCDKQAQDNSCDYYSLRKMSSSRFWKLSNIKELSREELFNRIKSMTEEDINILLTKLYKQLSHYEEGDIILIDDKTAAGNVKRDAEGINPIYEKSEHLLVQDGIIEKGIYKYIYRTHHDTETQFKNFVDNINDNTIQNNIFVEGITGNNSTDRLVRNEWLNDVWFYKHLHAMKEQIAIFDERLFTKIFGLEEAHLKKEPVLEINSNNRKQYMIRYKNEVLKNDENEWYKLRNKPREEQDKLLSDTYKNESGPVKAISEAKALTGTTPIIYKQKGVYVFTLIQEPDPESNNKFNLFGLSNNNNLKEGICAKLSTLSWDNKKGELVLEGLISNKENKYLKFNSISIHQGLLDKMYEVFGIKDKPHEKEKLTKQLQVIFNYTDNASEITTIKDKKEKQQSFASGLCIHSGRSKPSLNDMPQKLPFIQYASIENAVLDCKYSLVELLDFARYE